MIGGYKIRDQKAPHFLTFQVVYWADIFTRVTFRELIIDSFRYYRKHQGLRIHAYVIMSNHIHCILSATHNKYDLSSIIGNFKKHTSKQVIKMVQDEVESRKWWLLRLFQYAAEQNKRNTDFQVWTHDNRPMELHSEDFIRQKLNYIHENPIKAGWVEHPEDYLYSSARNYVKQVSVMRVDLLEAFVAGRESS